MDGYLYSVLTVCTGGYEHVFEVLNPNPQVEYVLVTDDPGLTSDTWKVIYKPNIWFLYVKHHQYEFVSTDVCLWIDGSYQIVNDPTDAFVRPFIESDKEFSISVHNVRHNIVEEAANWVVGRGTSYRNFARFLYTIMENTAKVSGQDAKLSDTLFQTSIMLTKRTPAVMDIFDKVAHLENYCSVENLYRDDQATISYIVSTYYYRWPKINLMNFSKMCGNEYFEWHLHGSKTRLINPQLNFRCFDKDFDHLYEIGDSFDRNFFE